MGEIKDIKPALLFGFLSAGYFFTSSFWNVVGFPRKRVNPTFFSNWDIKQSECCTSDRIVPRLQLVDSVVALEIMLGCPGYWETQQFFCQYETLSKRVATTSNLVITASKRVATTSKWVITISK